MKGLILILLISILHFSIAAVVLDPTQVTLFVNGFLQDQFGKDDRIFTGGVITVIQGDTVIHNSGFGTRNPKGDPFATNTIFPCASVSKLLTATMFMQDVEQGRVSLTTPVLDAVPDMKKSLTYRHGRWCGFVPGGCNDKRHELQMWHLMTHTGGIDEASLALFIHGSSEHRDLSDFLTAWFPPIIREPGKTVSYSNHGVALLGYVSQELGGEPFDDLVKTRILGPLGMTKSSFRWWELPEEDIAVGQTMNGAALKVHPAWNLSPAGNLYSTAEDLTRFMRMHFRDGELDGTRIIDAATAQTMHTSSWRPATHPSVKGACLQFYEASHNGNAWIQHGGDFWGSSSLFAMNLENKIGVIINYNQMGGPFRTDFMEQFNKQFLTEHAPAPTDTRPAVSTTRKIGWGLPGLVYLRPTRMPHGTFQRGLFTILQSALSIALETADGTLILAPEAVQVAEGPTVWAPAAVGPDDIAVTFIEEDGGYLAVSIMMLEIASWVGHPVLIVCACQMCYGCVCLTPLVNMFLALFAYRHRKPAHVMFVNGQTKAIPHAPSPDPTPGKAPRRPHWALPVHIAAVSTQVIAAWLVFMTYILVAGAMFWPDDELSAGLQRMLYRVPIAARVGLMLPLLAMSLTLAGCAASCVTVVVSKVSWWWMGAWVSFGVCFWAMMAHMWQWNLIGPTFPTYD